MASLEFEDNSMAPNTREIELISIVRWIWARKVLYLVIGLVCCLLAVGYSYIVPKMYTGKVVLLPKIPVQKAGLLGPLAALSGETTVLQGVDEELYGQILHSDFILDRVLAEEWPTVEEGKRASLFVIFNQTAEEVRKSEEVRAYLIKSRLRFNVIRFERDPITGIMNIKVTVPKNPALAAALANFLADELDEYNGILNSQQKIKHKNFVESRLREVELELKESEERLTNFLAANKSYQTSPKLVQRHGEIKRDVHAFNSIWLDLRSQLESAKIEVNKDLDSIIILDRAIPPLFRSSPNRRLYLLIGGFVGFLLATVVALSRSKLALR